MDNGIPGQGVLGGMIKVTNMSLKVTQLTSFLQYFCLGSYLSSCPNFPLVSWDLDLKAK